MPLPIREREYRRELGRQIRMFRIYGGRRGGRIGSDGAGNEKRVSDYGGEGGPDRVGGGSRDGR